MKRQESFERLWALRHDVPAESLVQYRFESRDGYRLPDMAAHYRTFCDTLESVVIELPNKYNVTDMGEVREDAIGSFFFACDVVENIEAAGLKVAQ